MIVHNVKIGTKQEKEQTGREHKKIYVGGAELDFRYKEMVINGKHRWELYTHPTIEFLTFDFQAKGEVAHCRSAIEECIRKADGAMIIVTANTKKDPLAHMEIDCALSNNIPVVGIHIDKNKKDVVPDKLAGKMTTYGWEWFAEFINTL